MSNFELLRKYIEAESISLVNVVAVPRSVSTALGRALNESADNSIYINEPFNRNNRSLNIAADRILQLALPVLKEAPAPLVVITKNMATYIGVSEFYELDAASHATIWSIRNPLVQMASLVTRMANDITVENGAAAIAQENVEPYLDQVTQHLVSSDISKDFSRTSWHSMGEHFESRDLKDRYTVVDGGELTVDPVSILRSACMRIGLHYSDTMVSGWSENFKNLNTGTSRFDSATNAWTRQAANTDGIIALERQPLALDALPYPIRDHIVNVAIPVYNKISSAT